MFPAAGRVKNKQLAKTRKSNVVSATVVIKIRSLFSVQS